MARLIIHQPKNFESRYFRYYNRFLDVLIDEIKKDNDVIESRYYKYANSKWSPTLLLSQDTFFDTTDVFLQECEMIIENYDTKTVKVASVSDDLTPAILNLQDASFCNKVLISQFDRAKIIHHLKDKENINKFSPWVYFPQNAEKFDFYWNRRKSQGFLEDKIYFRGTSLEHRKIISYLDPNLFYGGGPIGDFTPYVNELLNFKVGLSTAGRGEFCYRDVEYMAMGIPFIRFKYNSEMSPNLIPNYHYISVDRPIDMPHDKDCTPEHAKLLEQRFLEVKDDADFLNSVAKNAREYYENYIQQDNCIKHTINLLELDKW